MTLSSPPKPKRIDCDNCERRTIHRSPGLNSARVPVWECDRCEETTSGFYAGAEPVEIAADGGEQ